MKEAHAEILDWVGLHWDEDLDKSDDDKDDDDLIDDDESATATVAQTVAP